MWYVVSMDDIIAEAPTGHERQDKHVCHLVLMEGNTQLSGVSYQDYTLMSSHLAHLRVTGNPISLEQKKRLKRKGLNWIRWVVRHPSPIYLSQPQKDAYAPLSLCIPPQHPCFHNASPGQHPFSFLLFSSVYHAVQGRPLARCSLSVAALTRHDPLPFTSGKEPHFPVWQAVQCCLRSCVVLTQESQRP